ncbi:MAG: cob(I)yrinic acid a,c-diamide adenosyltransferase [Deltaproteobacteria bacterium]|nr:cob(I)yrinic acid a,c-diamide adenosyltransferase [Deltaproteobacteria bacterium]
MAIRINRVYTRTGDDGQTGLVGGKRVAKDDLRIHSYGEVDELNSVIGVVRALLDQAPYAGSDAGARVDQVLGFIQQELFDLGSELATPAEGEYRGMIRIGDANVARLEAWIDELSAELPELKSFVLPGGGSAGAMLHVARTVCRRAERTVTTLVHHGEAAADPARYLNRLSDLLFVQSRWIAHATGYGEVLWQHGLEPPPAGKRGRGRRAAEPAKD